jgi:hypothetical protein
MRRLSAAERHQLELSRLLVQAAKCSEIAAQVELIANNFMPASANDLCLLARCIRKTGRALEGFIHREQHHNEET